MRWLIFLDADHLTGPARLALDFARHAESLGVDVRILGLMRGRRLEPTLFSQTMEEAGLKVSMLHERRRFDPGVVAQFKAILAEFRPDVYQSHGYKGSALGRVAQGAGAVWQAVFHGFTWENWRVRLYHRLDVRWLRRADEVVAVSRGFEAKLAASGVPAAKLRWIPNAIDEAALRATDSGIDLRQEWFGDAAETAVIVGVLGRFSPEKGPDVFLDAFARASALAPELRAVMIGDGPMLEECRRAAAALPCAERVVLPGFRRDLAAVYRGLDLLAIPSRSEGMPTVMIEAMLTGVPVVSTAVGAVPDVLEEGRTGLIVPIEDPAALADAILRLARDGALRSRIASAAQAVARDRLTVAERTRTLLDHARCLIERRPLPAVVWEASAPPEEAPS